MRTNSSRATPSVIYYNVLTDPTVTRGSSLFLCFAANLDTPATPTAPFQLTSPSRPGLGHGCSLSTVPAVLDQATSLSVAGLLLVAEAEEDVGQLQGYRDLWMALEYLRPLHDVAI